MTDSSFTLSHHEETDATPEGMAEDVRAGLTSSPKWISSKYFYDGRGSELFEQITEVPEYYQTRAERRILSAEADAIMQIARPFELVELGSGSSLKTEILIQGMLRSGGNRFVGFDVSEDALREAAVRLIERHPELDVEMVVGNFEERLDGVPRKGRRLVLFLGGTIGNFPRGEREALLARVATMLEPEDHFLIGIDLVKDRATVEAAYNDAQGVTAEFNRNVLHVLNEGLDGDFPVEDFEHVAFYDPDNEWIEMRLRAKRELTVHLGAIDLEVPFRAGEELRTEISCKFTEDRLREALAGGGLELVRWMPEPEGAPGSGRGGRYAVALARRTRTSD